jgi:alpha-glucosidase (family GH31 glycosyl hydrolase)
MPAQALAVVATLVSFAQHGNRVDLKLDRGSAEFVWTSPSAFHFRRTLKGPLAEAKPERLTDPIEFKLDDKPTALHLRSKLLDVGIQKSGVLVSVHRADGAAVMADLTEPKPQPTGVVWYREAESGVRFYGLGSDHAGLELDRRGQTVPTFYPFLISSAGYGEYHPCEALYSFDFTVPDRYRIEAPAVDYYFYFGPTPKQIFEARHGNLELAPPTRGWPDSWDGLRNGLLNAVHQAMSDMAVPSFNLGGYGQATDELKRRAGQYGSLAPTVYPGNKVPVSAFRKQLTSFFDIYEIEARDRGFPIWHALPFQFPTDPECAHHADEFMLGDEMLIAPIYEPGNKRQVYFPPGNWTSLETNREYPGRSTAAIETAALPVFAHKGAIVPLDSEGGIALHYFPDLGGEFFFIEKDIGAYTQVHAAPAADVLRLEIEAKKDRDYEWVVHHVERPTAVGFEDRQFPWTYDSTLKNLFVRVHVKAGEDNVVHISW